MEQLSFLFTKTGFQVDEGIAYSESDILKSVEEYKEHPYEKLYGLGFVDKPDKIDATGQYLFRLAERFIRDLTSCPGLELSREKTVVKISEFSMELLLDSVPFVLGSEFVTESWLEKQYKELFNVFSTEIKAYSGTVANYLNEKNQDLQVPERVFFHIVENTKDEKSPFAFLATYATIGERGRVRHMPLRYALTEYKFDRHKLLELLACLNRAAEISPFIAGFVKSGELFHPLRLSADEAYELLKIIPELEALGIMCRIPYWWKKKTCSVTCSVRIGDEKPATLGLDCLLSIVPSLCVDGTPLTREEVEFLLQQTEGLVMIKGKWVEVNHSDLKDLLIMMEKLKGDMTLLEALRSSIPLSKKDSQKVDGKYTVTNGRWLSEFLQSLRDPKKMVKANLPNSFVGTLRPYQTIGYRWLMQMDKLGIGACLADDMGLGKTVQILAYLESIRKADENARALLIVPASLLGNWEKEIQHFTPEMTFERLHGEPFEVLNARAKTSEAFLTMTTYRMATRLEVLAERKWSCLILDEAQAIKNPAAQQTRQMKKIPAKMRIAMTGTPIENDLFNLWSLYDFLNHGLLGTSDEFRQFASGLETHPEYYAKLKKMVSPFLLRRVKTDKSIISDLPDKLEQLDYVDLSKKQVVLYRKLIADMQEKVLNSTGMERRGLVLSLLLRLKQICNHPDQYLGVQEYSPAQSGKFEMLKELAETIYEKRERVLVFTQFKEMTGPLDDFLADVFHVRGGVIHGGIPVAERTKIVERFQSESYMPYLVLSVRAGGTGLNLTKANHVIHFDRWWNPSVENQATDRAFRIGQQKNVMVHKFVCRGSVEEKIDALIESKRELAENVIGSGGEHWITELSNDELMSILRLD